MTIRTGGLDDLAELQQLFVETVTEVCKNDYTSEQIRVWTSGIENKQRWDRILTHQFVVVALDNEKIIGFCTLEGGSYIDLLFVHKDYQRRGIASTLYNEIEKEAKRQGQRELTADVSTTARYFFKQQGFTLIQQQLVNIKGIPLINYNMRKQLL